MRRSLACGALISSCWLACSGPMRTQPIRVLASATQAASPSGVEMAMKEHCLSCHDDKSVLDLRATPNLPPPTWEKVLAVLASERMPPRTGEGSSLTKADRASMIALVKPHVSHDEATEPPESRRLSAEDWVTTLHEITDPACGREAVTKIVRAHLGGLGGIRSYQREPDPRSEIRGPFVYPLAQTEVNRIAYETCACAYERDATRDEHAKKLFRASDPAGGTSCKELLRNVYAKEPAADAVASCDTLTKRIRERGGTSAEATVAACTAALSGPRLITLFPTKVSP